MKLVYSHKDSRGGDYISVPIEDYEKNLTQVISEIPTLTPTEAAYLTAFSQGITVEDNPDYDSDLGDEISPNYDPDYDVSPTVSVVPSIGQYNRLYNNTDGQKYHLVGDETKEFYIVELPPLEDSIGERSMFYLFGKGKEKPNFMVIRSMGNKEVWKHLERVPSDV